MKEQKNTIASRNKLIIEVVKLVALVALLIFAVYYINWLNTAANFPEF